MLKMDTENIIALKNIGKKIQANSDKFITLFKPYIKHLK